MVSNQTERATTMGSIIGDYYKLRLILRHFVGGTDRLRRRLLRRSSNERPSYRVVVQWQLPLVTATLPAAAAASTSDNLTLPIEAAHETT